MVEVFFGVDFPISPCVNVGFLTISEVFFISWKVCEKLSFVKFEDEIVCPEGVIQRVVNDELMVTSWQICCVHEVVIFRLLLFRMSNSRDIYVIVI